MKPTNTDVAPVAVLTPAPTETPAEPKTKASKKQETEKPVRTRKKVRPLEELENVTVKSMTTTECIRYVEHLKAQLAEADTKIKALTVNAESAYAKLRMYETRFTEIQTAMKLKLKHIKDASEVLNTTIKLITKED